ncbi:DUF4440 domain-containing protein [Stakelama sp. CBK3Z-3]|uniref:DUF4440 domain-containing protein n=1 Tax=Stakelama flava TaxID=2860338 RepID=A0ABS6XLB6_9SPHN|nr:DUF4440 domain-containing protein [Stakelama flava]MBW4330983.1 DUF4440 domain-containing protein [Stakelama flava]
MKLVTILSAGFALIAASPLSAQESDDIAPLARTIATRDSDFTQAFNAGRIADAVAFYEDDALLMVPGEPPMQGEKAIANVLAGLAKQAKNLSLRPAVVRPLGDDYALEVGVLSYEQAGENGTADVVTEKYQAVWHLGDDGIWYFASDMMNALPD